MTYQLKNCYFFYDEKNRLKRVREAEGPLPSRPFWGVGLFEKGSYVSPVYVTSGATGLAEPLKAVSLARMTAFEVGPTEGLRESGALLRYREFYDENWVLRAVPELKGCKITDFEKM
jgi:hypothetical protein